MSLEFAIGNRVGPSGVNLALLNIPSLNPEQNISIIDQSYLWGENVANTDSGIIQGYVGDTGLLPKMTVTDFLVTNMVTPAKPDLPAAPLYYSHICRFDHYSYGDNPTKHIYITDDKENILKGINYKVVARRQSRNIFQIQVLTDFANNEYVKYRVKYNRTDSAGSYISPGWTEVLNAQPLFTLGSPTVNLYEYSLIGPDANGLYQADVPAVPSISPLTNSVGISFELSPTFIEGDPLNVVLYTDTVTYTFQATGPSTFTVRRDQTPQGATTSNIYLQTATGNTWGAGAVNFNIGTDLNFDAIKATVNDDNYLNTNDTAYITASPSYYYLKPTNFRAIYLDKPRNVSGDDDWYIKIKAGSFTRRMDASGFVVPSGQGTLYQYYISEYDELPWSLTFGKPYIKIPQETATILDRDVIRLKNVPLLVEPSDVYSNGGFPPSSYLTVWVNEEQLPEDEILDWDVNNAQVKVAKILNSTDDVVVDYVYKEDYYSYPGFYGSGGLYPTTGPFQFFPLDLNPTPLHNHGMYASGVRAHLFVAPSWDLDVPVFFNTVPCYHNYTGEPSGVHDFYLGSVALGPHAKYTDVDVTDTRTRGGGLKSGLDYDQIKNVQPESQFYWDLGYFDGQAFPSNGVLVFKFSIAMQDREDEIREKINRHLAMGEYAIIDFE
jgi:hypothetical protein